MCRLIEKSCDNRGFTLVEVLVSLVVLALGLLSSVVGIMTALDYSLVNEMRNDAMKIAQEQEEAARNMPYANIPSLVATQPTVTRQVRNKSVGYTVSFSSVAAPASVNGSMTMLQVTVNWHFKNSITNQIKNYSYVLETIVRQIK
jgi:prepilin-type N-terminal cleavage/methylation domain-containing protein